MTNNLYQAPTPFAISKDSLPKWPWQIYLIVGWLIVSLILIIYDRSDMFINFDDPRFDRQFFLIAGILPTLLHAAVVTAIVWAIRKGKNSARWTMLVYFAFFEFLSVFQIYAASQVTGREFYIDIFSPHFMWNTGGKLACLALVFWGAGGRWFAACKAVHEAPN